MMSNNTFDSGKFKVPFAACIHWMCLLNPLFFKPFANFKTTYNCRAGTIGNSYTIGNMIAVTMRNENVISFYLIYINIFCKLISSYKGIEQNGFALYLNRKT